MFKRPLLNHLKPNAPNLHRDLNHSASLSDINETHNKMSKKLTQLHNWAAKVSSSVWQQHVRCKPQHALNMTGWWEHSYCPVRRGSEEHTQVSALIAYIIHASHVNSTHMLSVCYLRARSSDRPEKSKKFRYSDATNWLNSLLQRDRQSVKTAQNMCSGT